MYGYKKEIKSGSSFGDIKRKVKGELLKEGFGVITEIDIKKTLKTKIDVDYEDYVILGACNPNFAYKTLQFEKDIGLLLPCNVIIYKEQDKIFVSSLKPTIAMSVIKNDNLIEVAKKVEKSLMKVIDSI